MLTMQEVFEECSNVMLNQKRRAEDGNGCLYFLDYTNEDGEDCTVLCGVAPILKQAEIRNTIHNSSSFDDIADLHPEFLRDDVRAAFYDEKSEAINERFFQLMQTIQDIHDYQSPIDWLLQLKEVATEFNLDTTFLKQRVEG